MKRLILLRHAKSAWDDRNLSDFARPLAPRGRKAAPLVGAELARRNYLPDLIFCSSAARAMQTCALVVPHLHPVPAIRHSKSLYMAMPRRMLREIQTHSGTADTVMLVGHNPGMEDMASWLSTGERPGPGVEKGILQKMRNKFPTAGVAVIDFEVSDWADIDGLSGHLVDFFVPREITGPESDSDQEDEADIRMDVITA